MSQKIYFLLTPTPTPTPTPIRLLRRAFPGTPFVTGPNLPPVVGARDSPDSAQMHWKYNLPPVVGAIVTRRKWQDFEGRSPYPKIMFAILQWIPPQTLYLISMALLISPSFLYWRQLMPSQSLVLRRQCLPQRHLSRSSTSSR